MRKAWVIHLYIIIVSTRWATEDGAELDEPCRIYYWTQCLKSPHTWIRVASEGEPKQRCQGWLGTITLSDSTKPVSLSSKPQSLGQQREHGQCSVRSKQNFLSYELREMEWMNALFYHPLDRCFVPWFVPALSGFPIY